MRDTDRFDLRLKRAAEKEVKPRKGAPGASRNILRLSLLLLIGLAPAGRAQIGDSALSVRGADGKFSVWGRSLQAPPEWSAPAATLSAAVRWRRVCPGLESAGLVISGENVGWRVRVILARIDPALLRLRLDAAVVDSKPAWSIQSSPAKSVLAMNAGQFETDLPWGWIVRDGREIQPPRPGPLSSALIVDSEGRAALVDASEIPGVRSGGNLLQAFQSYPAILVGDGRVPEPLREPGRGVDLEHRDSRLALGLLRDGQLVVALTRFGGTSSAIERLPFGPTTPEMAAIMGALGCRRAVLLDGGLSGQLMLRDLHGRIDSWPGLRSVPLGLVAFPREPAKQ
jgi:hypothetical protein